MRSILSVIVSMSLVGCGDGECHKEDVSGAYRVHMHEISGTCGPVGDSIIIVGGSDSQGSCTTAYSDLSDDECIADTERTCFKDDGLAVTSVASVRQEPGGDKISGTMTVYVDDASGVTICASTYDIEYTR